MNIIKRFLIISFSLLFVNLIFGNSLVIKQLYTSTINIGGKTLKVGDKFDSKAKINWQSDNQAMKVIDEKNNLYVISPKLFSKYKATTFSDFISYTKSTYVRSPKAPFSLDDHRENFDNVFNLMDEISVRVGWPVNEFSYFTAQWYEKGQVKNCKLPYIEGYVLLNRDLFDDEINDTINLTIKYIEENSDTSTVITDQMYIYLLPLNIE